MKLADILENVSVAIVPDTGVAASRPTPTGHLQRWGKQNALMPHEFCKDREWCERKEKKKKKDKKVKDIENRVSKTI